MNYKTLFLATMFLPASIFLYASSYDAEIQELTLELEQENLELERLQKAVAEQVLISSTAPETVELSMARTEQWIAVDKLKRLLARLKRLAREEANQNTTGSNNNA
jgi:hypothetical protein